MLVLGMHRSGTSATARALNIAGADLPSPLMPAASDNDGGFWESPVVAAMHDDLFAAAGSRWEDWRPLEKDALDGAPALAFVEAAATFLCEQFSNSRLFVLKDPRMCRVMPLWLRVLDALGAETLFVHTARHPSEVAMSLRVRNGFPATRSLLLWLRYTLDAERSTRDRPRTVMPYELLLQHPAQCLAQAADELGLQWPVPPETAAAELHAFLSDRHRHHDHRVLAPLGASVLREEAVRLYETLCRTCDRPLLAQACDEAAVRTEAEASSFLPWLVVTYEADGAASSPSADVDDLEARVGVAESRLEVVRVEVERNAHAMVELGNTASATATLAGKASAHLAALALRVERSAVEHEQKLRVAGDAAAQALTRSSDLERLLEQVQARISAAVSGHDALAIETTRRLDAVEASMATRAGEQARTHDAVESLSLQVERRDLTVRDALARLRGELDDAAREGSALAARTAVAETELAAARTRADALDTRTAATETELAAARAQVGALDTSMQDLAGRLAILTDELRRAATERQQVEAQLRQRNSEIERIYASRSWRLTEPFRALRRAVGAPTTPLATVTEARHPPSPGVSLQTPSGDADYERRAEQEVARYEHVDEVHDLPEIFHYWSNKYLVPMMQAAGIDSIDAFYLDTLNEACRRAAPGNAQVVSIGAGNCDLEVDLMVKLSRAGVTNLELTCLDLNPQMLERGRIAATSAGVAERMRFEVQDLRTWTPAARVDVCIANQCLHHFVDLETIFDNVKRAIEPDGVFLANDMIGRNGHMRWPEALTIIEQIWAELPERYKFNHQLKRIEHQFENWDCSHVGFEGIRAEDILPLLVQRFGFDAFVGFGNLIDPFTDRSFGPNFSVESEEDRRFIDRVAALDEEHISAGSLKPTHMLAVMRPGQVAAVRCYRHWTPEFCIRQP